MHIKILAALLLTLGAGSAVAQQFPIPQPSERELKRVNYHRAMRPAPELHAEDTPLPPLLIRPDGTRLANAQEWYKSRRPELVRQWTAILGKIAPAPEDLQWFGDVRKTTPGRPTPSTNLHAN
jgi:hypothetical protein